ncbi:MAG TPA: PQQ-binding-like beta-propeller repeat protein [Rhizomicrobium sp.]|nr:PQQ-binding-like beta-propeller repeat protein [Rhizomicrobium sp.]
MKRRCAPLIAVGALALYAAQAFGQTAPAQNPAASVTAPVGSAGEAARARGARSAPEPYSSIAPVSAKVDVGDAQLLNAGSDEDNWLLYGRTYDNQRFSPLTGIDAANVKKLRPVAIIQTGITKSFENTPIVADGVMYLETGDNHVQAWNAATGKELWSYNPPIGYNNLCCGEQSRGVAVAYGKVFAAQLSGHVVALDARTGKPLWITDSKDALPEPAQFYTFTMAPQVYNGMVLVGNAGAEWPTRGFLEALDANTGKVIWRFSTTAAPDQPGGKTWEGDSWKFGGASMWNTPAIDAKNDLVIFATGNPNPDLDGHARKGDNAYTDSIVAIHGKTGKLAWWYQQVPHDLWDYDACAPVVLFDTVDEHGKTVPAAAEAGKVGYLYVVNRLTGKLIRKSQPFVTVYPNQFRIPDATPTVYVPGNKGGAMWSPPAYSPLTKDLYTMGVNEAHIFTLKPLPDHYVPGTPIIGQYSGGNMATDLKTFPPNGTFSAIDTNTGKIAWQYKSDRPMYGGALATASNLVFAGEMNGNFDAFDARSGALLWQYPLGAGVCTPPITYRVKGVQYIAVGASGCHGGEILMQNDGRPIFGDVMAVFALPD